MLSPEGLSRLPDRRPLGSLVFAVLVCEAVGASGSIFTVAGLESWYPSLTKPAIAPPNWVFGPVWTTLFALMGIAVWLVWRKVSSDQGAAARRGIGVFWFQFIFNIGWSAVFFGSRSIFGGLIVIALLWGTILATIVSFSRVDRRAGLLLLPYFGWVTFAAYLNYQFWILN